jgi:hypothetical protein
MTPTESQRTRKFNRLADCGPGAIKEWTRQAMNRTKGRPADYPLPRAEQRSQVVAFFVGLSEQDAEARGLTLFMRHIGVGQLQFELSGGLFGALLERYEDTEGYDIDRLFNDVLSYPPVALRLKSRRSSPTRRTMGKSAARRASKPSPRRSTNETPK